MNMTLMYDPNAGQLVSSKNDNEGSNIDHDGWLLLFSRVLLRFEVITIGVVNRSMTKIIILQNDFYILSISRPLSIITFL
jgi:hypothetical protein